MENDFISVIVKKGRLFEVTTNRGDEFHILPKLVKEYKLRSGTEISYQKLENIQQESDGIRAYDYAIYSLTRQAHSIGKLKQKLTRKGFNRDVSHPLIKRLIEEKYLDDRRFAENSVKSLIERKPAGRSYLVAWLRSKLIEQHLAESVVDETLADIDEIDMALKLLKSRRMYLSKFELETARRKAYNYLSRRSITYTAAKEAFIKFAEED